MIQLLIMAILTEAALILALLFKTLIRKPVMVALDRAKQGSRPVIVKTIEGMFLAVLIYSVYSVLKIRHRSIHAGSLNSTVEVLLAEKTLAAFLTGLLLFLTMVIDRLPQLIREESSLERIIKAEEKQLEEKKFRIAEQLKVLDKEVATMKTKIKKLEFECQTITNEAEAAKAIVLALKNQSEGFRLEYDGLLEYNQILRNQLHSIDQRFLKNNHTGWINVKSNIMPWDAQTPIESRAELGSETDLVTTNRCHQLLFSVNHATSWPRHRKPTYQH